EEGVRVAEDKAREIEDAARGKADEIIKKARAEAEKIAAAAKEQVARREESSQTLLKQAGRDLMLSLRKEINAMLDRLIVSGLRQALSPEELAKILTTLVKDYSGKENIIISLKKEDQEKLEKGFLGALAQEARKKVILRPSEDIRAGFIISYDNGKSSYDFTDEALAEYIGTALKPKLKEILE
ncbi:MAG: hypothetical protein V1828_04120, partial [Candidatus Omnitrophota bacterium]